MDDGLPTPNDILRVLDDICHQYNFGNAEYLRAVMKLDGAVISGSAALLAFQPDRFVPQDIDFYVPKRRSTTPMLSIMLLSRGYVLVKSSSNTEGDDYFSHAVQKVDFYTNAVKKTSVNIVYSKTASALLPITLFHSTIVMNFVSWYGAVCFYPHLTLRGRGLIVRDGPAVDKYRDRGFDMETMLRLWLEWAAHYCGLDPYCRSTVRHLRDRHVAYIPFKRHLHAELYYAEHLVWSLDRRLVEPHILEPNLELVRLTQYPCIDNTLACGLGVGDHVIEPPQPVVSPVIALENQTFEVWHHPLNNVLEQGQPYMWQVASDE